MSPLSVPFVPARWHGGPQVPRAVVVHGTVSPCALGGARAVARFFATHGQPTSAHYTVDPGETVQSVGDHVVAYHCGHNTGSIAFELCDPQAGPGSRWRDTPHRLMLDRAARDVAQTCLAYGIETRRPSVAELRSRGPHCIYGHNDSRLAFGSTTHSDPGPDFPWDDFLKAVRGHAAAMTDTDPSKGIQMTTPALQFQARLLAACQWAAGAVPANRVAVHAVRRAVYALAKRIR
jgi:N-acetyl-anhydromuramyl-L-alanine amidase AmpD